MFFVLSFVLILLLQFPPVFYMPFYISRYCLDGNATLFNTCVSVLSFFFALFIAYLYHCLDNE